MAATTLTTDGLLEVDISDMEICDTDELNEAEEKVLRERDTDFSGNEDEIPCAQAPTSKETRKTMPHKGKERNIHKTSDNQARGTKRPRDDNRKKHGNIEPKKARQDEEHVSITEKTDKSKNSIGLLQAHLDKGTCPKSLRYNVKANIMPDEDFKSDVSSIRKRAEHELSLTRSTSFL